MDDDGGLGDIRALRRLTGTEDIASDDSTYEVGNLDYAYLETATDVKELSYLLSVLRSGREGTFKHLENAFERRIIELGDTPDIDKRPGYGAARAVDPGELLCSQPEYVTDFGAVQSRVEREQQKALEALRAHDYLEAVSLYTRCANDLESSHPKHASNCALACLKSHDYDQCIRWTTTSLHLCDPAEHKLLIYKNYLRRGRAHQMTRNWRAALDDYKNASVAAEIRPSAAAPFEEEPKNNELREHEHLAIQTEDQFSKCDVDGYNEYSRQSILTIEKITINIVDDSDEDSGNEDSN